MSDDLFKMVLCVRHDLKMRAGKIAAQSVHAALGAYRMASDQFPDYLHRWERQEEPVVCLKIDSKEQMDELAAAAQRSNLPIHIQVDAGRTQVEPGSETVLAIGPGPITLIDSLTGGLKLQ
jgi:PTH2 family peptidyl-tRNA hydrolase